MKKAMMIALAVGLMISLTACASKQKKVEQEMKQPINCATAEGDLRALGHEKAHVAEAIAEGVSAIVPAGLVVGLVTGTEKEKLQVATGDYNKMIDKRIADIKKTCGIK
jgi:cytochrome c biogenesis protein ResB